MAEFDLAKTWTNAPKPARFAVPTALVLLASWLMVPASTSLPYEDQAEVVARALVNGDRSKVVRMATTSSADDAGKWYDLMSTPIAELRANSSSRTIRASLMSGNPERDTSLGVIVVIVTDATNTSIKLVMVEDGGRWKFDATTALIESEMMASTIRVANAKRR